MLNYLFKEVNDDPIISPPVYVRHFTPPPLISPIIILVQAFGPCAAVCIAYHVQLCGFLTHEFVTSV